MKQFSKFCIAILFSTFAMSAFSQQVYKKQIDVRRAKMEQVGDSLHVNMEIDLKDLKLNRNRYLTLTPIIESAGNTIELGDVLINGNTRSKSYNRSMALNKEQQLAYQPEIVSRSKDKDRFSYSQTIPYETWMKDAHLNMKQVLCGCGGHDEEVIEDRLINRPILALPSVYEVQPQYAFIKPAEEAVKSRGDQFELYLNFPVNKTNILPNYMNNAYELSQLRTTLDKLRADKHLDVKGIQIVGYASPEGNLSHNEFLSKGRAEALKKYLMSKLDFPARAYTVAYGGENWDGLVEALEKSQMSDKENLLSIVNNTSDVNTKKAKLKAYSNGIPYKKMLTEIYPRLRKVILNVEYNVQNFTVEESKEIIKKDPRLLSQSELHQVANTYPQGSSEFADVMEIAAKAFPKDKTANLNAAAIALSKKDIPLAESYLKKADSSTPEYANTMGALLLMKGDLIEAIDQFEKASKSDVPAAKYNLEEATKKYEIEVLKKQR